MRGWASKSANPFEEFERRTSKRGLLRRYARGRVKNFASREITAVAGGVLLWIMNGPMYGLIVLLVTLIGEGVDCLYLRGVDRRLERGEPLDRIYAISTLTAGVQAVSVSVGVAMAWFGPVTSASPLFAIAFLAGGATNGGLVLPFHRAAGTIRLSIYAVVAVSLFVLSAVLYGPPDLLFSMNASGTLMLSFVIFALLKYISKGFYGNKQITHAMIEKSAELKRVNSELAAHQKEAHRLALVARNANDSILLMDSDGYITWVNEAFTRTTGYSQSEAIGQRPGELLNGPETDPKTVASLNDAVVLGVPFRGEIQNRTKAGQLVWMETNQVPVIDETGNVDMIVAIERNVTEAKRHEREIILARQAAEDGARAKSDFLATMSHEIRTPMNGVIGMTDLLVETGLTSEQRAYSDTIRNSTEALLTIINDVLDLSRLDARKVTLDPVDFDLKACMQEPVRLLGAQARDKGLWLELDYQDGGAGRLHGDDGRLRQVLINLIGNAIKFTQDGGVTVRVRSCAAGADAAELIIVVEDTGIGIPKDKHEHIFERFAQADASTTRQFGGTGLGLTISRMLIEEMGGTITVESEPGHGSCFTIELRLPRAAQPPEAAGEEAAGVPETAGGHEALAGKRVLVAEDARVNRVLIGKYLSGLELDLQFAHDGREAVDRVLEFEPDIVLMDMSMPRLNGIEATRAIRGGAAKQPVIIALTANAFDTDKAACLAAGMDGFLTKPVRRAELLSCMVKQAAKPRPEPAQ